MLTRDRRIELLARCDPPTLISLADEVASCAGSAPTIVAGPDTGLVMMQLREPVCEERFYLGEVLVTRAEVELSGIRGWAMRIGEDRTATLAAAILDAEVEREGDHAEAVVDLCFASQRAMREARDAEWTEIAATEVHFDVID